MCTPSISRPDQVERLERGGLPRRQLRRRLRHEAATHRALARAPAPHRRRHRLQAPRIAPGGDAHQHLLDHAAIQRVDIGHRLERGQRHLLAVGPHARPAHRDLAAAEHHLTAHRAGPRGAALGDDAHTAARRAPCDPLRASFPTPSGPSGRRARTARSAHRPADRPAGGGGEIQQRWDERTVRDFFMAAPLSVRLSPRVWSPLVYHEQRRSRRFNFQQLSGHPPPKSQDAFSCSCRTSPSTPRGTTTYFKIA